MALQSSGTIKMSEINEELGRSSTSSNTTLKNLNTGAHVSINSVSENKPNSSAPHQMSEFYSYNHSAASLTSVSLRYDEESSSAACGAELAPTYYHDGSGTYPASGDTLYTDSGGESPADGGYYRSPAQSNGVVVGEEGLVSVATFSCGRSERRLKYNIEYMGDSLMGIPMYHFNYKDESYGKGRFVGTMVDDLERLGFEKALIRTEDGIFVNYDKIDVPFESVTN
jgi:hypothetical protein